MDRCRQRASASISGGETTAASHSGDCLDQEGKKSQSEWVEFGCLICVYKYIYLIDMEMRRNVFTALSICRQR